MNDRGHRRRRVLAAFLLAICCLLAATAASTSEPACKDSELTVAKAALTEAKQALDRAVSAIDNPTPLELSRLKTWLGAKSSGDATTARATLTRARAFAHSVTFLCAVRTDVKMGDVYAYVQPDKSFVITLGLFFFTAPDSGFNSKLGVLVHELTHFVLAGAAVDPKIYGTEQAKKLATSDSAAAQRNAENIEYFVESIAFHL